MLEIIFAHQRKLMDRYHEIEENNVGHRVPFSPCEHGPYCGPLDLNDRAAQLRLKDFFWRITEEIGEAANTLKLKPWKSTPHTTDETHYREEIIDALHFFVEMLILSGFDAKTATKMYLQKNKVNQFRQASNY